MTTLILDGSLSKVTDGTGTSISGVTPGFSEFASGTQIVFQQATAPTNWTKVNTYTDHAMRVVSGTPGTGGSVGFSSLFTSSQSVSLSSVTVSGTVGSTTLSTAQIPSHSHWISGASIDDFNFSTTGSNSQDYGMVADAGSYTSYDQNHSFGRYDLAQGGGGSHNHSFSGSLSGSGSISLAVNYVDAIICTKN